MPNSAPPIDPRTAAEIADQVQELLIRYLPEWREFVQDPVTGRRTPRGASAALIGVFARFSELVIQRLNQAPHKNFLAFLDLLGATRRAPQPARAPLRFTLAAGSIADAVVPAGTQVAAPPVERGQAPLIFETERELVVTPLQIAAIYSRDPRQDRYTAHPLEAAAGAVPAKVFAGDTPIEHILYLGEATLLGFLALERLDLLVTLKESPSATPLTLRWETRDQQGAWERLTPASDGTAGLMQSGTISFKDLASVPFSTLAGKTQRWLRCRLLDPITPATSYLPVITDLKLRATVNRSALSLDAAVANQLPIDLSKPFYPFGEQPKIGDTLYLAHDEAFSTPGATVTLTVTLDQPGAGDAQLVWEFGSDRTWSDLRQAVHLTQAGTASVHFTVPVQPQPAVVQGVRRHWIRARIASGSYGQPASYERNRPQYLGAIGQQLARTLDNRSITDELRVELARQSGVTLSQSALVAVEKPGEQWVTVDSEAKRSYLIRKEGDRLAVYVQTEGYTLVPATMTPPLIRAISLSYSLTTVERTPEIVTCNDFACTALEAWPFAPFLTTATTPEEQQPAFYVGFALPANRERFPNRKLSLYARTATLSYGTTPDNPAATAAPRLAWEYWDRDGAWRRLSVRDDTGALVGPGLIEFLAPPDFTPHCHFGQRCYWLRARWEAGDYWFDPRLVTMLLNTTLAAQTVTVRHELLGSSDGSKHQRLRTVRAPVLAGQHLEVCEPELPPAEEQRVIEQEEGADAITAVEDEPGGQAAQSPANAGRRKAVWVRWHEVPDFYASGPRDRHYVLDHLSGEVRFGDGLNGLIPPAGNANLRMARYQTGGGSAGNLAAGAIVQLKTTIPYVDSVSNPEPATGGAEAESLDALIERAPRSIRHRHRAVTLEDYSDLALLASPEVARVKCVPLVDLAGDPSGQQRRPGTVSLIVVPRQELARPVPGIELLNRVRSYIAAHSDPGVNLVVVGPRYLRVNVQAEVALATGASADQVEAAILEALARFMHPLTGGTDGKGWDFGRKPYRSDIYALIERVPGVSHVRSLVVVEEIEAGGVTADRFLVSSGAHRIVMVSESDTAGP